MFVFESELVGVEGYTLLLPAVSVGNVGKVNEDVNCTHFTKCTYSTLKSIK